ncbi:MULTISPECIES: SRPBCC domain-containing protein [unclassified Brevundimonas]|uniref:SRPBCC domain-containing protein n=1 Tax=unclassified Brevundimonas TaxID=2622653 RepID=UPI0025B9B028|nr:MULTISPECIES: SRPBCC domain-containing protein [unclassified Brevundimonas]
MTVLSINRYIDAPPETVWIAFTDHATEWFTPRPWTTPVVDYALTPGGRANVVMRSPEGELHSYKGVVLEVRTARLLVTTGAMTEGWEPQADDMAFVRFDRFEPEGTGTRYTAEARHWSDAAAAKHSDMGFEQGWGMAADQLAEVAEKLAREGNS